MKHLIIHESPSEVKTVSKFLNKNKYIVLATIGHFMTSSNKSLDVDNKMFKIKKKIENSKRDIVKRLKDAYKKVKASGGYVYIATDDDREGEVIAREVIETLGIKKKDGIVKRLRSSSLGKEEYLKAIEEAKDRINDNMADSGEARAVADKVIGFKLTEKLWEVTKNYKKYLDGINNEINNMVNGFLKKNGELIKNNKKIKNTVEKYTKLNFKELNEFKKRLGISIGRVQTPSLKLLVEEDLLKFKKELEAKLNLFLKLENGYKLNYSLNDKYETNIEAMKSIYNFLNKNKKDLYAELVDIKKATRNVMPPKPLDTQGAQSKISSTFGLSLKQIMYGLQKLYEGGSTSYMRTDSIDVPSSYKEKIKKMLKGEKFVDRDYKSDGELTQAGHHAILPVQVFDLNNLDKYVSQFDDYIKKIFEYVVKTSVASFMEQAKIEYITYIFKVEIEYKGEKKSITFELKDKKILKEGYIKVFDYDRFEPKYGGLKIGDRFKVDEIELKEKDIKLPGSYTVGSLVKKLKELGIGRPSTWESIVTTLNNKGYINISSTKININPKGFWVYKAIKDNGKLFGKIFDLGYTKYMEEQLDLIASGKKKYKEVLEKLFDDLGIKI